MRILIANEPRSYREVIAAAVTLMRPSVDVVVIAPDMLDDEVSRLGPQLVVCSKRGTIEQHQTLTWIVLYPEGKAEVRITVAGNTTSLSDLEFDCLLAVIDATQPLIDHN